MLLDEEENITPTSSEEEVEGEVVEETVVTETTVNNVTNEEEEEPAPVVVPPKEDKKKRNIIIIIIVIVVIIALVLALIFGLRGCNKEEGDNNNEPDTSEVVDDGMAVPGEGLLEEGDDEDGTSSGNDGTGTGSGSESGDGTGSGSGTESGDGSGSGSGSGSDEGSGSGDDGSGDDGDGSSGNTGDESGENPEGSGEGEDQGDDGATSDEPEVAVSYPYDEEDTTGYPSLSVYNVLNQYVYYTDERVTLDGATVTGIHGNTLTVQQYYSGSYYNVEVDALSLPEGVEIGKTIDIIGTVTTKYGKRVVLDEARVQVSGSYGFAYYNKIRLFDRKPDTYFYYSGAIFKRQYRIEYEVEKDSSEWKEAFSELDLYRAFKVEWRNWYKGTSYSTGTDRGETYLVVYNDVSEDSKTFYDIFFDGTNGNTMTSVNSNFTSEWTGVATDASTTAAEGEDVSDINSYHWFSCYSKVQLYYDDFYIGFDDFEAKYIQDYNYEIDLTEHQNITALLSGFFDDGDEVTVTGIFMEQHGHNITLQEYDTSAGQGGGYCLEVELDDTQYTDDIPQLSVPYAYLITVKGTVRVHESPTLLDYTTTLEDAEIQEFNSGTYGDNGSKTRMYYGTSSINTISNNQYGEYSAAYFHAGVQIYALPDSWDPDEDGDYWFIGRLRYKSGSLTYVTSEYIPVCIHADEQEGEMEFWKAVINGNETEEETKIYKVCYADENITYKVTITGSPEVAPGFTGIEVGEIIMSNFFQVHYFDEEITYQYTYNGSDYEKSDDRYLSMDLNTAVVATFSSNLGVED